jgi:hypothetical protein
MMPEPLIEPETLTARGDRVGLSVRMPWYRALPLSSVADVRWAVDGREVPRESITWTTDGRTYRLDELPPRHDEFHWNDWDDPFAVVAGEQALIRASAEAAGSRVITDPAEARTLLGVPAEELS